MIIVTNNDILGKNILHLRQANRMTREELELKAQWDIFDMEDLEEGRTNEIDADVLQRLCVIFQVEMDEIIVKPILTAK